MNVRIAPPQLMSENNKIFVYPSGKLVWQGKEFRVALGKNGVILDKKEGDGATPNPTIETVKKIAKALGVGLEDLMK